MPRPSIRKKLAAVLAVPVTALIVLAMLEVGRIAREAAKAEEQTELATAAIGPSGIITALQDERTWMGVAMIGQEDQLSVPVRGYEETRAQTDAAIDAFQDQIARRNEEVVEAYQPALQGLAQLERIRADVDAEPRPHDLSKIQFVGGIYSRYADLIQPFFDGTSQVALAIDDPELRQGAELADVVDRGVETLTLLLNDTINYATVSEGGVDTPAEIASIAALQSQFDRYAAILRDPWPSYARLAQARFPDELVARVDEHVDTALATGRVDLPRLLADLDVPDDQAFGGYMEELHDRITDRAAEVRSSARARQIRLALAGTISVAGAIALTIAVSRSITRPLRSLTHQATTVAEQSLPGAVHNILETPLGDDVEVAQIEPVTVGTHDEVAEVADALNTVQDSAVGLAVEQAVLRRNIADSFVNLGRRNQNLLRRQVDFITHLEANETDPNTLESLFRLDHLATRMRRNAESLLVLGGVESHRRSAGPVRLMDVVRAALGEVEDYQRVMLREVEPATIVGSLAADLGHLVAELLENALLYSPPDHAVEVRGRHKTGGAYALTIVDAGLGMSPHDLERANRRLAGIESFTVAPSKYLGHYVAGNLAARYGITVSLYPTPGRGITAYVELPVSALIAADSTGRGALSAHEGPMPAPPGGPMPAATARAGGPPRPPASTPHRSHPGGEPWRPRPIP